MTNEEILKKAIKKAKKNGFNPCDNERDNVDWYGWIFMNTAPFELIFSHDFAKAFWGVKKIEWCPIYEEMIYVPAWQYHLQQMVIAEDPIKYLEKHL